MKLDMDAVLAYHAGVSITLGSLAFLIPHSLVTTLNGGDYSHTVHEVVRLYGALTLAQGWMVYQVRRAGDGRVRRCMAEAYSIAYSLHAVALARAQLTAPTEHSPFSWLGVGLFCSLALFYGYVRWIQVIKVFELPGERSG
ncbi:unnamed protein product [Chrysoparadoxa australica]